MLRQNKLERWFVFGKFILASLTFMSKVRIRCFDTQHNYIQPNDIQPNDIQPNDIQPNDIQHNNTQPNI
jgi:hypothetical protein